MNKRWPTRDDLFAWFLSSKASSRSQHYSNRPEHYKEWIEEFRAINLHEFHKCLSYNNSVFREEFFDVDYDVLNETPNSKYL